MTETNDDTLYIAEIPYETGEVRFRFARKRSTDGRRWLRDGFFREFHRNGQVASEGVFRDDKETGRWREYYENGRLAAEGDYRDGKENGVWHFWDEGGNAEDDVLYQDGVEVAESG